MEAAEQSERAGMATGEAAGCDEQHVGGGGGQGGPRVGVRGQSVVRVGQVGRIEEKAGRGT